MTDVVSKLASKKLFEYLDLWGGFRHYWCDDFLNDDNYSQVFWLNMSFKEVIKMDFWLLRSHQRSCSPISNLNTTNIYLLGILYLTIYPVSMAQIVMQIMKRIIVRIYLLILKSIYLYYYLTPFSNLCGTEIGHYQCIEVIGLCTVLARHHRKIPGKSMTASFYFEIQLGCLNWISK